MGCVECGKAFVLKTAVARNKIDESSETEVHITGGVLIDLYLKLPQFAKVPQIKQMQKYVDEHLFPNKILF